MPIRSLFFMFEQSLRDEQVISGGYLYIIIRAHIEFNPVARLLHQRGVVGDLAFRFPVGFGYYIKAEHLWRLHRPEVLANWRLQNDLVVTGNLDSIGDGDGGYGGAGFF